MTLTELEDMFIASLKQDQLPLDYANIVFFEPQLREAFRVGVATGLQLSQS